MDVGPALNSACHRLDDLAARLGDALRSACGAVPALAVAGGVGALHPAEALAAARVATSTDVDVNRLVVALFEQEGSSLVRLARLFVDDRNAAEDLVQEAFIRLARSAGRIEDRTKAAAYLRSIVLNLARDQNRRGLVSLRHQLPFDDRRASVEDEIALRDDQRRVIEALRDLPHRQRDCLVLRYYHELGIADIAATLSVSPNSVKTHLQRGLAALERNLAESGEQS
jgi:RNA polymerase sigma factor (sigma-70 family)